ncbi:MAG: Hsp20/alpha crystallin family protein, partial [bacterium]
MEKFLGSRIDDHTDEAEVIATVPSVNIADKNKAFEVSVALPGMEKKDVQIEVEGDCLVISSQKQFTKEEGEGRWMRREYGYASFQRIFQLP